MLEPEPPEPPEPLEVKCTECREEENIDHIEDSLWKCNVCNETFSDGLDDGSYEDDYIFNR